MHPGQCVKIHAETNPLFPHCVSFDHRCRLEYGVLETNLLFNAGHRWCFLFLYHEMCLQFSEDWRDLSTGGSLFSRDIHSGHVYDIYELVKLVSLLEVFIC